MFAGSLMRVTLCLLFVLRSRCVEDREEGDFLGEGCLRSLIEDSVWREFLMDLDDFESLRCLDVFKRRSLVHPVVSTGSGPGEKE